MKNPKQKTLALALAVSITILALGFGAVFPLGNRIVDRSGELTAQKREAAALQMASEHANAFTRFRRERAEDLERVGDIFVNAETPIPFIEFLEDSAAASGVSLKIAPGDVSKAKGDRWPSSQVRLAGEGWYPEVLEFLRRLENTPVFLELKTITLTRLEETKGTRDAPVVVSKGLSFSIVLKAYATED